MERCGRRSRPHGNDIQNPIQPYMYSILTDLESKKGTKKREI